MKRHFLAWITCTLLILIQYYNFSIAQEKEQWENLFDGKTLAGWELVNGTAKYTVENGMIVGTTTPGSPNSFLCTKKSYGNFVLEVDFKADEALNSGIQIRSQSLKEFKNGRVHGYQVEIDPAQKELYAANPPNRHTDGAIIPGGTEPRRWTGGIYDEARRGWLCDLTLNEAARNAFKPGEWNHLRIEALGDGIRTWINGIFAAGIVDAMTPNGFIGLQVHAVKSEQPLQVCWKNIKIQNLGFNDAKAENEQDSFIGDWISNEEGPVAQVVKVTEGQYRALLLRTMVTSEKPLAVLEGIQNPNGIAFTGDGWTGTIENGRFKGQKDGNKFDMKHVIRNSPSLNMVPPKEAIVLFDGQSTNEWAKQKAKEWLTEDGPANNWNILPGGKLEVVPKAGSIITKRQFGDFKLHAEFRLLGEATNSGIYLMTRYEVNIKDSYGQTKGDPCGAPGNIAEPLRKDPIVNAAAPLFQWQTLDIDFRAPRFNESGTKIENARITVFYNGIKLYENLQPVKLKGAVTRIGEAPKGPLMLQEHGTALQFRNIWIVDQSDSK
ncbi:MAG: DUF1080 domain-containing protein [bacterium]